MHITHGDLPYWHQDDRIIYVTYRLFDSIPATSAKRYKEAVLSWEESHPKVLTRQQAEELEQLRHQLFNELLDKCLGSCILKHAAVRQVVSDSLFYYNHQRYHLHDYVIMPNHVHLMIEPMDGYQLQQIMASHKTFTAHRINKLLGKTGPVWQRESYDHIVRSENDYWNVVDYIARNPRYFVSSDYTLYLTNGRPNYQVMQNYTI